MKARLPKEYQSRSQADIMRQAQQMQADMNSLQSELEEREYTAKSAGDMVTATVNGKFQVLSLDIKPELIEDAKEDKEMLEDYIMMAINAAVKQAQETSDSEVDKLTSGLNIPGLF